MPRLRNRRGAMLVLGAVLFAGLMVMAVLAVDFTRVVAQRNEIHTAADAGSLAGAVQLLLTPTTTAPVDSAVAYAQRNLIGGAPTPTAELGFWNDSARTFNPSSGEKNAVRVRTQRSTNYLVGQLFNVLPATMRRNSIAWASAPVSTTTCVKPWAFPYSKLLAKLGLTDQNHLLTQDDLLDLLAMSEAARRDTIKHPAGGGGGSGVTGNFGIVKLPWAYQSSTGTYQNPQGGASRYEERIAACPEGDPIAIGDSLEVQPGVIPNNTIDGLTDLCANEGGTMSGGSCSVPLAIKVALFADPWPTGASALVQIRGLLGFVIEQVLTTGSDKGAVIGYFDVFAASGTVTGTGNSTLVRPVLVQ